MPDKLDRTVTSYRDFDLLVGREGKSYVVRVLDSPAGQASEKIPPRRKAEIDELVERLAALAPSASTSREALCLVRDLGVRLHDFLFHERVGRCLAAALPRREKNGEGLRIKLRLAGVPEISRWPWEYLYDADREQFLALSAATPIVRYPDLPRSERVIQSRGPLSVLVAIASPIDQPRLRTDRELEDIGQALAELVNQHRVDLDRLSPATLSSLAERLRREDVHVLHFIGLGRFDVEHGEGSLVFEDARRRSSLVGDEQLATLLLDHPGLRLVFLNSCEGARHGDLDSFGGVAQRLLQKGVPAVIAMQRTISDRAAVAFSRRFYEALAAGAAIDAAVSKGRRAVYQAGLGIEWGAPALFLRAPDGVLFSEEQDEAAPSAEGPPSEASAPGERKKVFRLASVAAALLLGAGAAFFVRLNYTPSFHHAAPPVVPHSPVCPSPDSPEIDFVLVPPGRFLMGSGHGKADDQPVHEVTISKPFCLGAFEVTVEQWERVMGDGKVPEKRSEQIIPKTGITWYEAQQFVERLNALYPGRHFFLPSEAQWEYAARAGSAARYSFGDDVSKLNLYANCQGKQGHEGGFNGVTQIGEFSPNKWQLYDMQGNVSEWVADVYGAYGEAPAVNPRGPAEGDRRVYRGGSFKSNAESCSVAHRGNLSPNARYYYLGFRIAAEPVE